MSWKQPTPTDINSNANLSFLDRAVFREILSLCQNNDYLCRFISGNKHFSIPLKRGQCILKVALISKDLKIDRKTIRKSVDNIKKWYTEMDIETKPFGLIITLKTYDELIKMDNEMDHDGTMTGQRRDNDGTTSNKIYKNNKNEKTDKNIAIYKTLDYLKQLKGEELTSFTSKYHMNEKQVLDVADTMLNYLKANGKRYSDYRAALHNWLKREKPQRGEVMASGAKPASPTDHY